jgi:hypothetical protein
LPKKGHGAYTIGMRVRGRDSGIIHSIILVFIVFACLTISGFHTDAFSQQHVLLSPQITELELPPGGKSEFEVMIANADPNSPVTITVGVSPILQSERGDYKIADKENEWSCARWIESESGLVTLAPGGSERLRFRVKVPYVGGGSKYAAITVSFGAATPPAKGAGVRFEYTLASYVELNISRGRRPPKAEMSNLEIVPVLGNKALENAYGKDAFYVTGDVTNRGDLGVFAKARLRIREVRGLVRREVPLGTGRGMVIPGATVTYRSLFKLKPPPGRYTAEAILDYGGIKPSIAKLDFSVTDDREIKPGHVKIIETVGLSIRPRRLDLRGAGGSRRTMAVTLHNVEDSPIKITASCHPLSQNTQGNYVVLNNPGDWSCHEWIRLEPDTFEVLPNARVRVKITMNVPRDASGARYSRIVFMPEAGSLSREAKMESYNTDVFLSILPDLDKNLDIRSLKASPQGRFSPIDFAFRIRNTGNCHVDIDAAINVDNAEGLPVRELRLMDRDTRILPGVTRTFSVIDDQGLESGTYSADLVVNLDDGKRINTIASFRVSD